MFSEILYTFLLSISPLGEARVGIPYGIFNGLHPFTALLIGLSANLLIYPIFTYLIDRFNNRLWRFRLYKQQSVRIMRRAHNGVGQQIRKYGFWGLMVFVMIPLPVTGAYMGTIAAYIFNIKRKHAFLAISLGVTISCIIMATGSHLGLKGIELV